LIASLNVQLVGSPANSFFQGKCFVWQSLSACGCWHGITSGDDGITDGVRSEASLIYKIREFKAGGAIKDVHCQASRRESLRAEGPP